MNYPANPDIYRKTILGKDTNREIDIFIAYWRNIHWSLKFKEKKNQVLSLYQLNQEDHLSYQGCQHGPQDKRHWSCIIHENYNLKMINEIIRVTNMSFQLYKFQRELK